MDNARSALLDGDAEQVCSLLTEHGQERVMQFRVNYDDGGKIAATDPRLPQTCPAMVGRLYADAQSPRSGVNWPRQLRAADISVSELAGDHALVALKVTEPYGPLVTIFLVRAESGWMIDDSDVVPSGH